MTARSLGLLVGLGLLAAACSSGDGGAGAAPTSGSGAMQVIVASIDTYAGAPQRVLVGLPFGGDGRLVSFGSVSLRFSYTGTAEAQVSPEPGPEATATYVPTPGTPDGGSSPPTVTQPDQARGLYQATDVTFDRAGIWEVEVTADVQGQPTQDASAAFSVVDVPALPAPGQEALPTDNLTLRSKGVPPGAIDSRAVTTGKIPDPGLHRWTIAEALRQGRPALVVFATPVYCVSRFCGPVTDLVEKLSKEYADRAVFIHVEIWRDFQKHVVNQAAADWLYRGGDLTEPWVYLVGSDGTILDRWSSIVDEQELAAELEDLPPMKG